jgi:ribonuclease P protein component
MFCVSFYHHILPTTSICGLFYYVQRISMTKTQSLNENYGFRRLYKTGKCSVQPHIAVYTRKNRLGHNRLGITTTKKIGNAVARNRARRLIREAYRLSERQIPTGIDIVVVARQRAVTAGMEDVRKSLLRAFAAKQTKPRESGAVSHES